MGLMRYRTASGEVRRWTLKEIVQGKSMQRVTHPVFVVFPIAFCIGALVLDLLSKVGLSGGPLAATYAILGAVAGAVLSIITGAVDRSLMRAGSRIRGVATRHALIQTAATAIFVVNLAVRWGDRKMDEASVLWIVLDVLGSACVLLGGDVGASMVFKMGYRVDEVPTGSSSPETAPGSPSA